ncbi:putative protein dehydration-induced 19 [Helianthus anomalus]
MTIKSWLYGTILFIIVDIKPESPPMSIEDKEEKCRRSEFVQGMLLSTILGDDYL